ncbi:MAG: ugpC [Sphingomonas bacterium]|uniref:ATP-binding cassette domain-containing protein n=1 Tax=Sphingomonas bacterium TaxID=1895847 RepID=UPI002614E96A|nr:ATP-binding cassette domain-containing protein [Sphingomonas bacterium]MDB5711577.1 ugpC [Sphingomonas bacterium]
MTNPRIGLEDVSITLKKGEVLVEGLSLTVYPGEILAVVGESGIGKSTLLNVIAGFVQAEGARSHSPWHWLGGQDEPTYRGQVLVDGVSIDATPPEKRHAIGMVMQGGFVYEHLSVLENLMFPMRARVRGGLDRRKAARRLLEEVDLFDELSGAQLELRLKQRAGSLSGGQRQRLALARMLAKDPSVFLLDEAFANLDPVLRYDLFQKFVGLVRGTDRCAMVVTHDLSDLLQVQHVLLLGRGERGPGYCSYRRVGASLIPEGDRRDGSPYWSVWHDRLSAAAAGADPN